MKFNANYQADPYAILEKIGDFLAENGIKKELIACRRGPRLVEYIPSPDEQNPRRHQFSLIINPDPYEDYGGYEVFRWVVLLLYDPAQVGLNPADYQVNVAASSDFEEYYPLVHGLEATLDQTFRRIHFNVNTTTVSKQETIADSPEAVAVVEIEPKNASPTPKPWERIPDDSWHRQAVMLWWQGNECPEISKMINVSEKTIRNIFTRYRSNPQYGEEVVPTVQALRKKGIR